MDVAAFIYGTAWKKDRTTELVLLAVQSGFRAIDTANQPKHYQEPLVGDALVALQKKGIRREDLFLQTKFTPVDGQDHRVPYDTSASITEQVEQSFRSSLEHLHTDYLDSYLLHGPYHYPDLGEEDWEVWSALEKLQRSGNVKRIGISNVNAGQVAQLIERASIKPQIVQNRCFANRAWDAEIRDLCRTHKITYQGFSLLTANPYVLVHPTVKAIASKHKAQVEQVVYRFAMQLRIVPLNGTTSITHMEQDLKTSAMALSEEEMSSIESISVG